MTANQTPTLHGVLRLYGAKCTPYMVLRLYSVLQYVQSTKHYTLYHTWPNTFITNSLLYDHLSTYALT